MVHSSGQRVCSDAKSARRATLVRSSDRRSSSDVLIAFSISSTVLTIALILLNAKKVTSGTSAKRANNIKCC